MALKKGFWPITAKYAIADVLITFLLYFVYALFESFTKIFHIDGWAAHAMHFMHSLGVGLQILVFGVLLLLNFLEIHKKYFVVLSFTDYLLGKVKLLVIDATWGFGLWFVFYILMMLQVALPTEGTVGVIVEYGYGALINIIYAIIPLKFLLHLIREYQQNRNTSGEKT